MCLRLWGAAGMSGHRFLLGSISQEGNSICDICQRKKKCRGRRLCYSWHGFSWLLCRFLLCGWTSPLQNAWLKQYPTTRKSPQVSVNSSKSPTLWVRRAPPWRDQGVGPNPRTEGRPHVNFAFFFSTNLRNVCLGPIPNTTLSSFQKIKTGLSKWQRTESNFYQEDRWSCDQGLLFIHFKNSVVLDFLPINTDPCFMMGFVAAGPLIELFQEVSQQIEIKQRPS